MFNCAFCHHPHASHATIGAFRRHYRCLDATKYTNDAWHANWRVIEDYTPAPSSAYTHTHTHTQTMPILRQCDRGCILCCCNDCMQPITADTTALNAPINESIDEPTDEQHRPPSCMSIFYYMICCWLRRRP
ncbi:hypothetical protein F-M6_0160 [Faustovirus]|nr:hypothetical protein F-M6_0160 [Faustovirus]